jgi:hypothetical protein
MRIGIVAMHSVGSMRRAGMKKKARAEQQRVTGDSNTTQAWPHIERETTCALSCTHADTCSEAGRGRETL